MQAHNEGQHEIEDAGQHVPMGMAKREIDLCDQLELPKLFDD